MRTLGTAKATLMDVGSRYPRVTLLVAQHGDRHVEISFPVTEEKADELRPLIFQTLTLEISGSVLDEPLAHPDCPDCQSPFVRSTHEGSPKCRNRTSIAAGGTKAHCTCVACF